MTSNGVIGWPDQALGSRVQAGGWPVSVSLLQRAWHAIQGGEFDSGMAGGRRRGPDAPLRWQPQSGERVAVVVGAGGGVGATSVALALATAAAPCRLVECAAALESGLAAAATAELGEEAGWTRGRRAEVVLLRRTATAGELPATEDSSRLTVVDVGSSGQLDGLSSMTTWATSSPMVLVVPATIPGLRRAELALPDLPSSRLCVASLGSPIRRWPREMRAAMGHATTALAEAGRWVSVPPDPQLALHGLSAADLPRPLLAAGQQLLRIVEGL